MSANAHIEMHRDHVHWLDAIALWREEIGLWNEEYDRALADLASLETALRKHAKAIADHLEELNAQEGRVRAHEHALAEFESGGRGEDLITLAKTHKEEEASHARKRAAHERIKKHYHTIMAHWALLHKEITRPL